MAQTDALNKRLRSVEEENGVRGAQMVHVQRDLDQHNNQILTLQGQVNGFTSLLGGMLGGGGIQGALVGGGGAGPVGGIVGYNGGGGMFRGAQTSVLHRPIPSTHTTTTTTPTATSAARRGAGSRSATLPTAGRSTRSKSKQGSTRYACNGHDDGTGLRKLTSLLGYRSEIELVLLSLLCFAQGGGQFSRGCHVGQRGGVRAAEEGGG